MLKTIRGLAPSACLLLAAVSLMTCQVAAEQPDSIDDLATFMCVQHRGVDDLRVAGDTDGRTTVAGTWPAYDRGAFGSVGAPRVADDGWRLFSVRCADGHQGVLAMRWTEPLPEERAVAEFRIRLKERKAAEEERQRQQRKDEQRRQLLAEHGQAVLNVVYPIPGDTNTGNAITDGSEDTRVRL